MTSIKTILLGSAAGIVAVGAAQAADLPVKRAAAAVQYVETCPAYGKGFYKLPGTDTCLKIQGRVEAKIAIQDSHNTWDPGSGVVAESSTSDELGWYLDGKTYFDVRTPTEFGTLRSYFGWKGKLENGVLGRDPFTSANDVAKQTSDHGKTLDKGYIEWAGFLIGRQTSQFLYFADDDIIGSLGGSPTATSAMQFTYIWSLPGGTKATIGLEDSDNHSGKVHAIKLNPATGFSLSSASDQGPQRAYDVVGTLSTEQAWGSAKLSGAAHHISVVSSITGTGIACTYDPAGMPGSCPTAYTWGWAALAGITFNLPQLGAGDQIALEGVYSDGAITYAGVNDGADGYVSIWEDGAFGANGMLRTGDRDAFAYSDGNGGITLEKEKAYSLTGQLRHYWTPLLRSNLSASQSWMRPGSVAKSATWSNGGVGNARVLDVSANLIWGKKAKTAEIGVEVVYKKVNQDLPTSQTASDIPDGISQNPSSWGVEAFIQRDW